MAAPLGHGHGVAAGGGGLHREPLEAQGRAEQVGDVGLVVDHQDPGRRRSPFHVRRCDGPGPARPAGRRSGPAAPSAGAAPRAAPHQDPAGPLAGPPGHEEQGLDHDVHRHLGLALDPVDEPDGHLGHLPAVLEDLVDHLDLEPVALGPHRAEVDAPQDLGPVGPEPRRRVGDVQPEEQRRRRRCRPGTAAGGASASWGSTRPGRSATPPRGRRPRASGATRPGRASGSCERSASISTKASQPRSRPQANPAR